MHKRWFNLALDSWALGVEASTVIGLRAMKLATGTATAGEATRMVTEKVEAAMALQAMALTGRVSPDAAVAHYRRKVRANRKRLTR